MSTVAVVMNEPERLDLRQLPLPRAGAADVVVRIDWSGISTGTERLLWLGRMPDFPGMGYPLVPGYESVGEVVEAGAESGRRVGERVFVPGARCYGEIRGLFGGAASRVVIPGEKALPIDAALGEEGVLLALAATALHAIGGPGARPPELIVGHGVLGRLLARLALAAGGPAPTVWERNPQRIEGGAGYRVCVPDDDPRRDYRCIVDASGDAGVLDDLIARLAHGGEIVLAGFYSRRVDFEFPPAFMREARLRVAAEWRPEDLAAVTALLADGSLSLAGLVTHRMQAADAQAAYRTAFEAPECLKMVLDWRNDA